MEGYTTATIHINPHQFKEYIPTPNDFDSVYTEERVRQVAEAFRSHLASAAARSGADGSLLKEGTGASGNDSAFEVKSLNNTVSTVWAEVGRKFSLFSGYVIHHCEVEVENEEEEEEEEEEEKDKEEVRPVVNAALLSESDSSDCSVCDEPNWELQRLSIVFRPRGPAEDPFDKRDEDNGRTTIGRRHVSELLTTCAEHIFAYQHRTHLFQVFVNRERFRFLRWDRSGLIVTDAVDYVNDLAGTRILLQFLYGFCKLSDTAQGRDCTAVRVKPGSCGWIRMDVLMFYHGDVDHTERPGVTSDVFPANFAFPEKTLNAPVYPLFEHGLLHPDPCAACNPSADHHSIILYPDPLPVWKYIRDLFRESLGSDWPRYELTVCGRKYLVGKPMFEARGMVSRGTRGYIALEWSTQRFVFLKDAWRPFYVGVDREGNVLSELNEARVPYVPTHIAHEDVPGADGKAQETETSRYASHASMDLRKNVQHAESDRARLDTAPRIIAPLPSRKSTRPSDNQEAGLSSVHSRTPSSPLLGHQDSRSASHTASRGVKRSAKDVQEEDVAQGGSGLRHLTHYRIIVAEVCLPSTAFTSGKQWVRIVLHCIQGHQAAYEDCKLIHRDVSVGNILIYPKYYAGNETLDGIVFWEGRLCDWELAKKIVPDVERQPERTGTWQFMSVRCLRNPTLPVLLPDELESFSYAMLYNAVRFMLHNMKHIHGFVKQYFDDSPLDGDHRKSAPHGKEAIVNTGKLQFGHPVLFRADAGNNNHPLNAVIRALLEKLRARYDVLAWQASVAEQKKREEPRGARLLDKPSAPQHDTPSVDVDMIAIALGGGRSVLSSSRRTVTPLPTTTAKKAQTHDTESIPRPPPADFEHAASLETHHAIIGIFEAYLYSDEVNWPEPGHDVIGYDRLDGYRPPPRAVPCTAQPAKRAKTALRRAPIGAKASDCDKGQVDRPTE